MLLPDSGLPGRRVSGSEAGTQLRVRLAQITDRGQHARNQDCHGACVPAAGVLITKGAAFAIADGIGSSEVGHLASEIAVRSLLDDYFSTPDSWSIKKSAHRVIDATNTWLYAQSHRAGHTGVLRDQACACTLSALILHSCTAHIFHVGDSRIYRWRRGELEQLTRDHSVRMGERNHVSRVLGTGPHVELDHESQALELGDVFALLTDGVFEHVGDVALRSMLAQADSFHSDLQVLASDLVALARANGSTDDATVQIVQVVELPVQTLSDLRQYSGPQPCPPLLSVGQSWDGFKVLQQIHASSRSHVYLVEKEGAESENAERLVMKIPSLDGRHDPAYLERMLLEEWMGGQIHSAHVVRSAPGPAHRSSLYVLTYFVPGETLSVWMREHPKPGLDEVRTIIEQLARGLQAMHRRDILHRDLRPDNVLIDSRGTACIIDLGSARAAGLRTLSEAEEPLAGMGTLAFTAPEQFLGVPASPQSDQYALAAMAYQMLSGNLPYGTQPARARSAADLARLTYVPVATADRELPLWIDGALARALHPDPAQRFEALSEFVQALRQPMLSSRRRQPLSERHPLRFWQGLCAVLALALLISLWFSVHG